LQPRPARRSPRPCRRARGPDGERGLALLLVLLLTLILLPFASEFALQVRYESRSARNVTDQLMIENAIDGQFEIVLARLRYDYAQDAKVDSWVDEWNSSEIRQRQEEDLNVNLSTRVFDEQGKFNLRLLGQGSEDKKTLNRARLKRILLSFREDTSFSLSDNEADAWAERIFNYANGRKEQNIPSMKTVDDRPIHVLDELMFLEPVHEHSFEFLLHDQRKEDEVAPGLHRYVTVYGNGKLNVNTADVRVLKAYFWKDEEIAHNIKERRESAPEEDEESGSRTEEEEERDPEAIGNPFTEVAQISEVEGVTPELLTANNVEIQADFDVKSAFFSCRIVAVTQATRRDELFVVERVPAKQQSQQQSGELDGWRFHLHQERTDALEALPEEDTGGY
jgi:type II secretory pathway component PulK